VDDQPHGFKPEFAILRKQFPAAKASDDGMVRSMLRLIVVPKKAPVHGTGAFLFDAVAVRR